MTYRHWALLFGALFGSLASANACIQINTPEQQCVTKEGLDCETGLPVGPAAGAGQMGSGGALQGTGGVFNPPAGAGIGAPCSETVACRTGLTCAANGQCAPSGASPEGSSCFVTSECAEGLTCTVPLAMALQNPATAPRCVPQGTSDVGDGCQVDSECKAGLRCMLVGLSAQCAPQGTVDVGGACTLATDCLAGLTCGGQMCVPAGPVPFPITGVPGVNCEAPATENVRAYFEVPGAAGAAEGDFFRLPFPNDVRIKNGKVDLTGFPTPGSSLLGFDPIKPYVDAIQASEGAFSGASTVYFRFSGGVNFDTIAPNIVDLTAPDSGSPGLAFGLDPNPNTYVCHNAFTVRIAGDVPLKPGHTYAVFLTGKGGNPVTAKSGSPVAQSKHLAAMLADSVPADPALAPAHSKYAAFRTWLATKAIDPGSVVNATVYTVGTPSNVMKELAAAAYAAPVPKVSGSWVKCEAGVTSPCPQSEGSRGCGTANNAYDEYHALVGLPIFQKGTAPYLTQADGGDISLAPVRTENVCVALTVPKGTPPQAGLPLVVFGHGTGGSFRSFVRDEVSGAFSSVTVGQETLQFAVLGFDLPEHGPRRGASMEKPDNLFFNFNNPLASRGNPLQGAADLISVARFAASLDGTVAGAPLTVDKAKIVYFGHSQGSTHGSLALPYAAEYKAAVLSGNGASLMHALVSKTLPVNVAAALPVVLGHPINLAAPGLPMGTAHPVLTLLQHWIDPADPLNFGAILAAPETPETAKNVFLTYGQNDNYSPPSTIALFARAASALELSPDPTVTSPDQLQVCAAAQQCPREHVIDIRQYAPTAMNDGHFVVFDVPKANLDAIQFLAQGALGQKPSIP